LLKQESTLPLLYERRGSRCSENFLQYPVCAGHSFFVKEGTKGGNSLFIKGRSAVNISFAEGGFHKHSPFGKGAPQLIPPLEKGARGIWVLKAYEN